MDRFGDGIRRLQMHAVAARDRRAGCLPTTTRRAPVASRGGSFQAPPPACRDYRRISPCSRVSTISGRSPSTPFCDVAAQRAKYSADHSFWLSSAASTDACDAAHACSLCSRGGSRSGGSITAGSAVRRGAGLSLARISSRGAGIARPLAPSAIRPARRCHMGMYSCSLTMSTQTSPATSAA